jgi:hypothetical protein
MAQTQPKSGPTDSVPVTLAPADPFTLEADDSTFPDHDRRGKRRKKRKHGHHSLLSSILTPSTKALLILGASFITLAGAATWFYFLLDEMDTLRRKMASDAFNAKEKIASLESLLNSPRMRTVTTLNLEPQLATSVGSQGLPQIRRPENGAVLLNLSVPQQSDRWDLEMRDVTGSLRAKMTTGSSYDGRLQVMLTDVELNTYTIIAKGRGADSGYVYAFSLN